MSEKDGALAEAMEINRMFVAMLALDSEEECAEVAEQLGIEDGGTGLWDLSQRYALLKARTQGE